MSLFRTHAEHLRLWQEASEQARQAQNAITGRPSNLIRGLDDSGTYIRSPQEVDPEAARHELAAAERRMDVAKRGLLRVRRSMIGLDLTPPELPEALSLQLGRKPRGGYASQPEAQRALDAARDRVRRGGSLDDVRRRSV